MNNCYLGVFLVFVFIIIFFCCFFIAPKIKKIIHFDISAIWVHYEGSGHM